jgi:methionyl-tRNA formyltransferase
MEPWPKTYTFWHRAKGSPVRLILGPVSLVVGQVANLSHGIEAAPGTVLEASGDRLIIAAGHDAVMPQNIQPAGKRLMAIDEFLRGHGLRPGERFGREE